MPELRGGSKACAGNRLHSMKFLDCFCGLGGASEGFHREGFECTGIDIVDVGYPYRFIQGDMRELDGADFKGFDVIWGSPPCRDFSQMAISLGHRWKKPPDPNGNGLKLVKAFIYFVEEAKPRFWIMENVPQLEKYLKIKPRAKKVPISKTMRRDFWGNFPLFLQPMDSNKPRLSTKTKKGAQTHMRINGKIPKYESWERAKIPLACSLAFARACKEQLEKEPKNICGT